MHSSGRGAQSSPSCPRPRLLRILDHKGAQIMLRASTQPMVKAASSQPIYVRAAAGDGTQNPSLSKSLSPKPAVKPGESGPVGLDEAGAYDDRDGAGCSHW